MSLQQAAIEAATRLEERGLARRAPVDADLTAAEPRAAGYDEALGVSEDGIGVLLDLLVVFAAQTAGRSTAPVQIAHQLVQASRAAVVAVIAELGGNDPHEAIRWTRKPIQRANQLVQSTINRHAPWRN